MQGSLCEFSLKICMSWRGLAGTLATLLLQDQSRQNCGIFGIG